jgi:hypothetical protein
MKEKGGRRTGKSREIVLLADLAPRKDPTGGAGKLLFGEHLEPMTAAGTCPAGRPGRPARRSEATTPRKVKGGRARVQDLS